MNNKEEKPTSFKEISEDFEEILHDFKRVEDAIKPIIKRYMEIRRQYYLKETGTDLYEMDGDKEFQQMLTLIDFDNIEENLENQLSTDEIRNKFITQTENFAELIEAKNNKIIVTYYKLFNDILAIDEGTPDIETMNKRIIAYYKDQHRMQNN